MNTREARPNKTPAPTDFDRASVTWTTRNNSHGRWRVIASVISSSGHGIWQDRFVLTPMVMAGDVYGTGRLPLDPPYSYQFVASINDHAILREYCDGRGSRDTEASNADVFSELKIHAPPLAARRLEPAEITPENDTWPLTGRLDARAGDGIRWLIEFPINHVNTKWVDHATVFQIETGPVLIPVTLVGRAGASIAGGFALAFLFFNRLDRADLAMLGASTSDPAIGRGFCIFGRLEDLAIELYGGV